MKTLRKFHFQIILCTGILLVVVFSFITHALMTQYENSVISVYATQQDAYVQLVLDQINLQEDRSDTEIIEEILSSLDTSSKKYWTLTKEQTLLFVKDVTETNRYKGFTTASYYVSDSANEFLTELSVNHIINRIIEIDGDRYVASGVIFEYNNSEYKICLLTNTDVILDNNYFLSTKIWVYIYITILILIMVVLLMSCATVINRKNKEIDKLQETIKSKNIDIDELVGILRNYNYYNTRQHIYSAALLSKFLKSLEEKKVAPVTVMDISFNNKSSKDAFLEKGTLLLDEKVLRFYKDDDSVILVFIHGTEDFSRKCCDMLNVEYKENRLIVHEDIKMSLTEECRDILE